MRKLRSLGVIAAVVLLSSLPFGTTRVSASNGSLRIDPAMQAVPPGASFQVTIMQSADVATIGAQATITFDPAVLQLQEIQKGPAYSDAALLVAALADPGNPQGRGTPPSIAQAIDNANAVGELPKLATFLNPGAGSAAAGDNVFVTLTMLGVAPGNSAISLTEAKMIDEGGAPITVTPTDGAISVDGAAPPPSSSDTPVPGATPAAQASAPAAAPTARNTPATGVLGTSQSPSLTAATVSIEPATQKVAKDSAFTFTVKQQVDGSASAVQAKVTFNKEVLQVVKLEPGAGWGGSAQALSKAATDANSAGAIDVTFQADKTNPPKPGESTILTVTMKGVAGKNGTSDLNLTTAAYIGTGGNTVTAKAESGKVTIGSGGGGSSMTWILVGVVVIVIAAAGGGGAYIYRRRQTA